jgi:hypothetical protein
MGIDDAGRLLDFKEAGRCGGAARIGRVLGPAGGLDGDGIA